MQCPLGVDVADFSTEADKKDIRVDKEVHLSIYRVMMRRMAGSSKYKQRVREMRQSLAEVGVDGEQLIKTNIFKALKKFKT